MACGGDDDVLVSDVMMLEFIVCTVTMRWCYDGEVRMR